MIMGLRGPQAAFSENTVTAAAFPFAALRGLTAGERCRSHLISRRRMNIGTPHVMRPNRLTIPFGMER